MGFTLNMIGLTLLYSFILKNWGWKGKKSCYNQGCLLFPTIMCFSCIFLLKLGVVVCGKQSMLQWYIKYVGGYYIILLHNMYKLYLEHKT